MDDNAAVRHLLDYPFDIRHGNGHPIDDAPDGAQAGSTPEGSWWGRLEDDEVTISRQIRERQVTAYRVLMQANCGADQAEAVAEYLQVIPGFYAMAKPQELEGGHACVDFSIVVREEVQEGTLLRTAEERVSQYLWQRPDLQPVEVAALAPEPLPEDIERQLPPEHIPPRRSL
jgi:hypothetical protein